MALSPKDDPVSRPSAHAVSSIAMVSQSEFPCSRGDDPIVVFIILTVRDLIPSFFTGVASPMSPFGAATTLTRASGTSTPVNVAMVVDSGRVGDVGGLFALARPILGLLGRDLYCSLTIVFLILYRGFFDFVGGFKYRVCDLFGYYGLIVGQCRFGIATLGGRGDGKEGHGTYATTTARGTKL